jgi:hypothetical protein
MKLEFKKITHEMIRKFKSRLLEEQGNATNKESNLAEMLPDLESIEGAVNILYLFKNNDKITIRALKESGFFSKEDTSTAFEKSLFTIAKSEQVDKILYPNKKEKKKWMTTKLSVFLSHSLPEAVGETGAIIAKKIYNKCKSALISKLNRVNTSPKVLELAKKHPNIDINRIVSLYVLDDRLDLTNDTLQLIDQTITIIQEQSKATNHITLKP